MYKYYIFLLLAVSTLTATGFENNEVSGDRPLSRAEFADGLLSVSGIFRTIFDNTDYSSVRLPKPDERTFFQSDVTLYLDIKPTSNLRIGIGPKLTYEFGNEDGIGSTTGNQSGSGATTQLRIRADYTSNAHKLTFGHFRDTQSPLTFELEEVDDDLAGIRWRYKNKYANTRIMLSRLSVVADNQYETFLGTVKFSVSPFKAIPAQYSLNVTATHEGGFDTADVGGYPPNGERKKENFIVGGDIDQPILWNIYAKGEGAYSISRSDINPTVKDNAFWGELGWRNDSFSAGARFYRVGRYFTTPFGIDLLRNEESIAIISDYFAGAVLISGVIDFTDYARLYLSFEQGLKFRYDSFDTQDFEYNIEKVIFVVDL